MNHNCIAGDYRALFLGYLHNRGRSKNPRTRLRTPSGELLEKHVEHHGLCRCGHRVLKYYTTFACAKRQFPTTVFATLNSNLFLLFMPLIAPLHSTRLPKSSIFNFSIFYQIPSRGPSWLFPLPTQGIINPKLVECIGGCALEQFKVTLFWKMAKLGYGFYQCRISSRVQEWL